MHKIPKILHLYWGKNVPLTFMRYLTVRSFVHFNPDYDVIVHYPEKSSSAITWTTKEHKFSRSREIRDYFPDLVQLPRISIRQFNFTEIGVDDKIAEVFKSDFLRWYILGKEGGIWSDFDILYIRPMTALYVRPGADVGVCCHTTPRRERYHSIGFLFSAIEDGWSFFSDVFKLALSHFDPADYQSAGRRVLDRFYWPGKREVEDCVISNIPFHSVYPVPPGRAGLLYGQNDILILPHTIGVHWFGGCPAFGHWQDMITEKNIKEIRSNITDLMIDVLRRIS